MAHNSSPNEKHEERLIISAIAIGAVGLLFALGVIGLIIIGYLVPNEAPQVEQVTPSGSAGYMAPPVDIELGE